MYLYKYVSVLFVVEKYFSWLVSKGVVLYFYNHNKNLYNKFKFLKN